MLIAHAGAFLTMREVKEIGKRKRTKITGIWRCGPSTDSRIAPGQKDYYLVCWLERIK